MAKKKKLEETVIDEQKIEVVPEAKKEEPKQEEKKVKVFSYKLKKFIILK